MKYFDRVDAAFVDMLRDMLTALAAFERSNTIDDTTQRATIDKLRSDILSSGRFGIGR